MEELKFDVAIVGGGIVGLATAYKLQLKYPKLCLAVVEKEDSLAFHQTGRNSGVIHSGLYYKPNSLKAKNCVNGRKQLVQFAKNNNIDYDVCGKIVLATNKREAKKLLQLKINGEKNGLKDLKILDSNELKEIAAISSCLVNNIGTLDDNWRPSFLEASKYYVEQEKPIIFQP